MALPTFSADHPCRDLRTELFRDALRRVAVEELLHVVEKVLGGAERYGDAPGSQQQDEEEKDRGQASVEGAEEPRHERPISAGSANRYPMPQTVRRYRGWPGSDSIFARSLLMCEFTVCSYPSNW